MKLIHKYLILGVAAAGAFTACDNYDADDHKFDNVVYLDVSKTDEVQPATFSNNTPTVEKPIQATLAYPEGQDVAVSLTVDPSLVATYNARYGSDWKMLDAKYYELSSDNVTIHAGKTASEVVTLRLKGLMGEGEQQTGALPIDETYLLPVRISHSSMSVLKGSEAAYYVVKRSSAITVAAQLTDNWIEFPSLDKYGDNSMPWNKLRAMTYEALIYIDDFALTDIQGNPVSISTVMGEEDCCVSATRISNANSCSSTVRASDSANSPDATTRRSSRRVTGIMSPALTTRTPASCVSMSTAGYRARRPRWGRPHWTTRTSSIWPAVRCTTCGTTRPIRARRISTRRSATIRIAKPASSLSVIRTTTTVR